MLEKFERIKLGHFPTPIEHLKKRNKRQYVMLGFSDGTKDGGYLKANWSIFTAKETLSGISKKNRKNKFRDDCS